jgi:hypothetical protein
VIITTGFDQFTESREGFLISTSVQKEIPLKITESMRGLSFLIHHF